MDPATSHPRPSRSYDLRAAGLIYIFITLLIALGGFNSQNNLLFWAFSFALAILLVSGLLSGQMLLGLRVERRAPARAVAGRPVIIRYRVVNRGRLLPAFALEISETVPADQRRGSRWLRRPGPRAVSPLVHSFAFVPHVPPGGESEGQSIIRPAGRGRLRLESIRISTGFPFGIIGKVLRFQRPASILVRPRPIAPSPDLLRELGTPGRTGRAIARRQGPGDEFFGLRSYLPGDRPRTIAWRASARRDEFMVRQTSPPAPTRLIVSLLFPGVLDRALAEQAISEAAGLIAAAALEGFDVGLDIPQSDLFRPARPGPSHAARLQDDLALLDLARLGAAQGSSPAPRVEARGRALRVVFHAGPVEGTSVGPGTTHVAAAPRHAGTRPEEAAA